MTRQTKPQRISKFFSLSDRMRFFNKHCVILAFEFSCNKTCDCSFINSCLLSKRLTLYKHLQTSLAGNNLRFLSYKVGRRKPIRAIIKNAVNILDKTLVLVVLVIFLYFSYSQLSYVVSLPSVTLANTI